MLSYSLNHEMGKQRHTQRKTVSVSKPGPQPGRNFRSLVPPSTAPFTRVKSSCQSYISLHQLKYIRSISVVSQNHWQRKKKNLERQQEAKSTLFHIKELDGRFPQILTHFSDSGHTGCQHLCTCTKAVQTKKQHVGRWGKHYSSGTASLFEFNMLLICYS